MNIPSLLDKGDLVAVFTSEGNYTYQDLAHLVRQKVISLPHRRGDAVPFIAEKTFETLLLFLALLQKECIACPISPRLPPDARSAAIARLQTPMPQETATALFTSGTTGTPKIALHSLDNHLFSALGALPHLNLFPGDRWHLSLPLYHVGAIGILFRCLLAGAAIDLTEGPATHISLVPTQLRRLLEVPPKSPLKLLLLGGAPLPDLLLKKAQEQGLPIMTSYGLTETSSLVTLCKNPKVGNEIGEVLPHRNLFLENGEIIVSGKILFLGYLGEEKKESLKTGDLAIWENGKLLFQGRKDDLIISGGENIQPEEIERHLLSFPGIEEAYVTGIPSEEFGARPVAFLSPHSLTLEAETLRSFLKERLPRFKIPDQFFPLPEMGTETKVSRRLLRQIALADRFKSF